MNRTDGLVRRNKSRAAENGHGEANSSHANSVDENDVIIQDRDNEVDDTDSKETRLTLMEEVLLLGLKDKEVNETIVDFSFIVVDIGMFEMTQQLKERVYDVHLLAAQ